MAISSSDLILRPPERLTDFPDGGGRMVWGPIVDGQINNLFPDVDAGDRVFGRVSLRPANLHVSTPTRDILAQAIGLIVARPADPAVNVVMFSTGSSVDTRADAQRQIETYRLMANESPYALYGTHQAGTTVMTVWGREGMPAPTRGDVLMLSVEAAGLPARTEPVKVSSVLYHETEEFGDSSSGVYRRDVMQIELTRPLEAAGGPYPGNVPARDISARPATRIRATRANESARFYGTQPLEEDIVASPSSRVYQVKVPTPYQPLVPSVQSELPAVDVLAGMGTTSMVPAGASGVLTDGFSQSLSAGVSVTRYLGMGFARGSLSITAGATALVDDGEGGIVPADGLPGSPWGGTVDYETGRVDIRHDTGIGSTTFALSAQPAAPLLRQGFTDAIGVTINNQFNTYIRQLVPPPAPGTVIVDARMSGQWVRLADDGRGTLSGATDPADGSGTINYASGSLTISLPALPDLDSSLIISWGSPVTTQRRDGDVAIQPPAVAGQVDEPGIDPGSLEITYLVAGTPVVLTDDGNGVIVDSGSTAVGSVVYSTGHWSFTPPTLPDHNSAIQIAYDSIGAITESITPTIAGSVASLTLASAPVAAGTVRLRMLYELTPAAPGSMGSSSTQFAVVEGIDDGAGNITTPHGNGTINYSTGSITFPASVDLQIRRAVYGLVDGRMRVTGYETVTQAFGINSGQPVDVSYSEAGSPTGAQTETVSAPRVEIDLTPLVIDHIVPGGVRFSFGGRTYVDRAGSLVYDVDPETNAGTPAGSIDYSSGVATIAAWQGGGSNAVQVQSLLTRLAEPGVSALTFRTPGSPVQAGSLIFRATTLDGVQLNGSADINGAISGDDMRGSIDVDTGVVNVEFGELVTAAGNEGEPWYDPALVDGDGNIWRPRLVDPGTAFFGVVVFEYVQVSPVILGLDPILLPNDGRVQIFRPGYQVVLIDERETVVSSPTAGQLVDLGRERLSQIEVRDDAGTPVESTWYTLDLDAGTVTFADPVPIGWEPYELPIHIRHRVDARKGILSVQHNGLINLTSGLDRDFAAESTLVCSALVLGERYGSPDVQARFTVTFDQASDEIGVFRDELQGNPATASYNYSAYPWEITNRGAITERWKLRFVSPTTYVIIGETVGQLPGTYSIESDAAPINPITITPENPGGDPYFTIPAAGFGGGWATGNIIRRNTVGADPRVWFCRVTQPSDEPEDLEIDSYRFQAIGGAA